MENKRYHIVIASILFALVTWISVNLRNEYTVFRSIPIVLENEKEGMALKYPIPKQMMVRFHGTGWMLAALSLTPDIKYYIDVSSLSREKYIVTSKDVLEHIKLPVSVQVTDIKPDTLVLAMEEYKEKRVKIISRVVLDFHEGYGQVGPLTMQPESVIIGGPVSGIDQISEWPTIYKKFEGLKIPVNMDIPLEEPGTFAVRINLALTHISMNVQPFAEKIFSGVPVTAIAVPTNREVIFSPPKIDIIIRGGIEKLSAISHDGIQATVNYQLLTKDSIESIIPVLNIPQELKIISRKPERVQFIIRKRL
jgi:YbbR domain-containing protein